MKIIKTIITLIILLAITIYLPISVKATTDINDRIIEERKLYPGIVTNVEELLGARFITRNINTRIYRSTRIQVTRTSSNTGMNLEITPTGHYVEIAIFKRNSETEVIGRGYVAPAGQMSAFQWSASELGDTLDVDVFISACANVWVTLLGAVTF